MNSEFSRSMPRREAISTFSSVLMSLPFLPLLSSCSEGEGLHAGALSAAANGWATGGTAAMKGIYPDPFATGLGSTCSLYKASTLGPCHALTVDRKDVSEGQNGLPLRLALLILDSKCQPVPGATVEIWHTSVGGLYSGSDAISMCTSGDAKAKASRWFRGLQTADKNGRVDFDSCYPGWYGGRAVHIHFTVRANGKEYLTSQLFFDDALNTEIFTRHPVYKSRGDADTTNTTDGVIKQSRLTNHIVQTKRQEDGALLAWKALVISA
jgi:protocatechuate 3,4-dioxygenase beta subunit